MPELPEVETVRRGLAPVVEGKRIERLRLSGKRLRLAWPEGFAQQLTGRRVEALSRRAKFLLWRLSGGLWMISHLGMSGRFTVFAPDAPAAEGLGLGEFYFQPASPPEAGPHDHLEMTFDDGTRVVYTDPRRFGFFDLVEDVKSHPMLRSLGPEPLAANFDAGWLAARLAGRTAPVKNVLLDQTVVAGVGNIYACEALFLAAISPRRRACSLAPSGTPTRRVERLVTAVKQVLEEAIAAGGSTLRDHRLIDGGKGSFQQQFRVYGRAGAPCPRAGCDGVIRRIVQSGRGTFHCPRCQR